MRIESPINHRFVVTFEVSIPWYARLLIRAGVRLLNAGLWLAKVTV